VARRRFFAAAVENGAGFVPGAHLARVLRAQPGQVYELAHQGAVYLAEVTAVQADGVRFRILESLAVPPPGPSLDLAVALFKFDRFEWMLEKATELGLSRLQPLTTRRTETRLAEAAPRRLARWRAILHDAAEQSRRASLPEILAPQPLVAFLAAPLAARRLLLSELPGEPALAPAQEATVLLAGPEGGFAPEEFAAASQAGFIAVSLGPRILRCETAVLAALARLAL